MRGRMKRVKAPRHHGIANGLLTTTTVVVKMEKIKKYSEKIICYLICGAGVAQSIGDWRVASTDHSKEPAHLLCTNEVLSVVVFRSISVKLE